MFDRLDEAIDVPLIVVCAPAGYGKSLLVASWLSTRTRPAAWVNLRSSLGRPSAVWESIIDGVDDANWTDPEDLAALGEQALRPSDQLPTALGTLLSAPGPDLFLILDDYQAVVEASVHEQIIELAMAARSRLHVIVLTRHDPPWPLPRMRLDGVVKEIRTDQLEFTPDETSALFEQLGIPLDLDQAGQLLARTQGWVAGLRLAALGAAAATDPAVYIGDISGRSGYIADYLMNEVFEKLPARWRDFLSRISVLDVVCADLAESLGAGPDSAECLGELARHNVFIHELQRSGWYRLHPLLLDFLRSRVTSASHQRRLHARAARWFLAAGEPQDALDHAISARQWGMAADLVGTHVVTWTVVRPPGELLRRLEQVPQEAVLTQPGLAIGIAAALTMSGRPDGVDDLIRAAEVHVPAIGGRRRRRYRLLMQMISFGQSRWSGDLAAVLDGLREIAADPGALGDLGLTDWVALRTLIVSNTGSSELWMGQWDGARIHLAQAASEGVHKGLVLPVFNARAHLGYLRWRDGDLDDAERIATHAMNDFTRLGIPTAPQAAGAYLALCGVCIDRDHLDAADRWLDLARSATAEPHIRLAGQLLRARLLAARGQMYDGLAVVRSALEEAEDAPVPGALRVAAAALRDEFATLAGVRETPSDSGHIAPLPQTAEPGTSDASPTIRQRVTAGVAQSLTALAQGRPEVASRLLREAIDIAAAPRLRAPFLLYRPRLAPLLNEQLETGTEHPEFVVDLLNRGTRTASTVADRHRPFFVPLTKRELGVLRYLASSMTTTEIADTLYVSTNTLKTHQRSVYQKLGAASRREAVLRARELNLL